MKTGRAASKWFRGLMAGHAALALLTLVLVSVPLRAGAGGEEEIGRVHEAARLRGIEGVWRVTVTLRHCETGAVIAPPHQSLVTFTAGGTLHESNGAFGFAPEQRSEGHGVWHQIDRGLFRQRMVAQLRFETPPNPPAPGFLAGWQVVEHLVTLVDRYHFTSEGTNQFFDTAGEVYRSGCSTAAGLRFN
jgi:hypothetical protein